MSIPQRIWDVIISSMNEAHYSLPQPGAQVHSAYVIVAQNLINPVRVLHIIGDTKIGQSSFPYGSSGMATNNAMERAWKGGYEASLQRWSPGGHRLLIYRGSDQVHMEEVTDLVEGDRRLRRIFSYLSEKNWDIDAAVQLADGEQSVA